MHPVIHVDHLCHRYDNRYIYILKAELTDPDSIKGCCMGIDIVISTVGITKQKDGLTDMDDHYGISACFGDRSRSSRHHG